MPLPSLPRKEKNKFRFAGAFAALFAVSCCLCFSSADAAFFKKNKRKPKPEKVIELETARYRVYYLTGVPMKKPELGTGDYCELQYKSVFQEEWIPDNDRLIQIDFLDKAGYIAARDVVADKDFNSQGEHYGYLWVACELTKTIKTADVKEVFQKNKITEAPVEEVKTETVPAQPERFDRKKFFEEKSPELKKILNTNEVLTEKDIEKALSLTRSGGSASAAGSKEKPKAEGEDGDDVSLETSFA